MMIRSIRWLEQPAFARHPSSAVTCCSAPSGVHMQPESGGKQWTHTRHLLKTRLAMHSFIETFKQHSPAQVEDP
eukprot:1221773-Amphidinium_carterae.2